MNIKAKGAAGIVVYYGINRRGAAQCEICRKSHINGLLKQTTVNNDPEVQRTVIFVVTYRNICKNHHINGILKQTAVN
jgi:hypothetical protein